MPVKTLPGGGGKAPGLAWEAAGAGATASAATIATRRERMVWVIGGGRPGL
jgi:hypothetical protein